MLLKNKNNLNANNKKSKTSIPSYTNDTIKNFTLSTGATTLLNNNKPPLKDKLLLNSNNNNNSKISHKKQINNNDLAAAAVVANLAKNFDIYANSNSNSSLNSSVIKLEDNASAILANNLMQLHAANAQNNEDNCSIDDFNNNLNPKHVCNVCKRTFKTQNILRQHTRIHTGDKPFVCEICNKAFSQMASLKYHSATHSDERPFSCDYCNKTFKLKPPFKKHVRECRTKHDLNNLTTSSDNSKFALSIATNNNDNDDEYNE